MAHQASVNGRHESHHGSGANDPGDVVGDIATLVELQVRLASLECRENARAAAVPLVAVAAGVVLSAGAVPVALLGIARLLAVRLGIDQGWSMLLAAAATIVVAALALAVSSARLSGCFPGFHRSREELRRNVAWIRALLHGKSPVRR